MLEATNAAAADGSGSGSGPISASAPEMCGAGDGDEAEPSPQALLESAQSVDAAVALGPLSLSSSHLSVSESQSSTPVALSPQAVFGGKITDEDEKHIRGRLERSIEDTLDVYKLSPESMDIALTKTLDTWFRSLSSSGLT